MWGSECASSRPMPRGSIQQPPRRLPGLRCETGTCLLQAPLCKGAEANTHGSWQRPARDPAGELSQNLRSSSLACHTLLPQTWVFAAHSPSRKAAACGGLGGSRERQMALRAPGAGPTPHREEQSGRRGALFPPWPGWAPAPTAAARWGFRRARVVGRSLTRGTGPETACPRAPRPLSVGACPLSPGLASQEPVPQPPSSHPHPHPSPAPLPGSPFLCLLQIASPAPCLPQTGMEAGEGVWAAETCHLDSV